MARYFDAHRYFAVWGSPRLMLRLPKAQVDLVALKPYFAARNRSAIQTTAKHVVLDFDTAGEEREFGCDERVSLATLSKLRKELAQGDLRCAYLAWLIGLENGEYKDRALEPPVPAGLAKRTPTQNALIRFLGISPYAIAAAVKTAAAGGKRRTVKQLLDAADERREGAG